MLKGLDPLLGADLLHILRSMGHGDDLIVADAHFPAAAMAGRLVRLDGIDGPRALRAILSVMPLDDFVDEPCGRIEVIGDPTAEPEVCRDYQRIIDAAEGGRFSLARIERFAFYERAPSLRRRPDRRNPPLRLRPAQDGRHTTRVAICREQHSNFSVSNMGEKRAVDPAA